MPKGRRKELVEQAAINKTIRRLSQMWRAIAALLAEGGPERSGRLELACIDTQHGPVRVLRIKGHNPVHQTWQAPTAILDATLRLETIRQLWPQVELKAEALPLAPHRRFYQVMGSSYSKGQMAATGGRRLRNTRASICRLARECAPKYVL